MLLEDIIDIIDDLNTEIYLKVGQVGREFNLTTDGYSHIVKFGEIVLWDSRVDEKKARIKTSVEDSQIDETYNIQKNYREWFDELKGQGYFEPLKPFLKRRYNQEVERLQVFKF